MSETDPTPETPVTIGDRMQWWRAALALQIASMQGTPAKSLSDVWAAADKIASELDSGEGITAYNLLDGIYTILADHTERLDRLQEAVGANPYQSLTITTVRGLLYTMLNRLSIITTGPLPVGGGDASSDGDILVEGRRYATFGPITGITISSDGRNLTASNWSGWTYYIQTTDPAPQIAGTPTSPNGWTDEGLTGTVNFSVEAQYPIAVYLKRPPAFEGFYIWTFDDGELESWSGSGLTRYGPATDKYPGLSWNTNAGGFRYLLGDDWGGWQWESAVTSFSAVYGNNALSTVVSSASGTVPAGNNWLYMAFENPPSTGWYIKLTPPEPS